MSTVIKHNDETYELVGTIGLFGGSVTIEHCLFLIGCADTLLPCWLEIRMDADNSMWAYCGRDSEGIECNHHNMWETFSVHENVNALQIDVFNNVIGIDWKRFGIIKQ